MLLFRVLLRSTKSLRNPSKRVKKEVLHGRQLVEQGRELFSVDEASRDPAPDDSTRAIAVRIALLAALSQLPRLTNRALKVAVYSFLMSSGQSASSASPPNISSQEIFPSCNVDMPLTPLESSLVGVHLRHELIEVW